MAPIVLYRVEALCSTLQRSAFAQEEFGLGVLRVHSYRSHKGDFHAVTPVIAEKRERERERERERGRLLINNNGSRFYDIDDGALFSLSARRRRWRPQSPSDQKFQFPETIHHHNLLLSVPPPPSSSS